jgi:hypothetical protein
VKLEGEGTQIGASDFSFHNKCYTKCSIKLGGWDKLIITSFFNIFQNGKRLHAKSLLVRNAKQVYNVEKQV